MMPNIDGHLKANVVWQDKLYSLKIRYSNGKTEILDMVSGSEIDRLIGFFTHMKTGEIFIYQHYGIQYIISNQNIQALERIDTNE